ncbi:GntR family transcriptional regulator [Halalkalibacillus halophilus]|uniref:GntR family transcriptional regulator n=1 Tax=Halalkalibacillus halophilus TaxID=392827 RepID=UPI00040CD9AC|nr:GntR family transcriptional regulator [Halalkalibacillus halophilus]
MHIMLDPTSRQPIYEQIVQQVKARVLQGVVIAGDKVPSVREMSAELTVNPNTVSKAYKELEREGLFITFRGKGTFVSENVLQLVQKREVKSLKLQTEKLVQSAHDVGIESTEVKKWVEAFYKKVGEKE